jgi:hypothetical protein
MIQREEKERREIEESRRGEKRGEVDGGTWDDGYIERLLCKQETERYDRQRARESIQ